MDRKVKCPVDISRARIEALSASVPRTKCQSFHTSLAVPQVTVLNSYKFSIFLMIFTQLFGYNS